MARQADGDWPTHLPEHALSTYGRVVDLSSVRDPGCVELSSVDARRIALAAQGFGRRRPARPTLAHVLDVVRRLHVLQIDTVNVLVRAHYLPVVSRLGPYPMRLLDDLIHVTHDVVELNGHAASFVPVEVEPPLRSRGPTGISFGPGFGASMEAKRPGYLDAVRQAVADRGPLAAGDLDDPGRYRHRTPEEHPARRRDGKPYAATSLAWGTGGSDGKNALLWLVQERALALAGRGPSFDRLFDLRERVLPETPDLSPATATAELVRRSVTALGVATPKDVAGYFGLQVADVKAPLASLVDEGVVLRAQVEGWKGATFVTAEALRSKPVTARALLGPFDSLTWSRDRTKRLFDFDFSFEIYVPEPNRRYGYYVLPFLLSDRLVARVDLRADRKAGTLVVPGAFAEPGVDVAHVTAELAAELRAMAGWLGLDDVVVGERGDLAAGLSATLR